MKPALSEIWASLASEAAESAELRMQHLHEMQGVRLYATRSWPEARVGVLVQLPGGLLDAVTWPKRTRRVRIRVAKENDDLPMGQAGLLVELLDREFEELFERLGADVCDAVVRAVGPVEAVRATAKVMQLWAKFMDRARPRLSEAEVKGLIGELAVLERLFGRLGAAALRAWVAPEGAIRDFEFSSGTIEVKTFTASQGATVRINDPLQLEPDAGVRLVLACQALGASDDPGDTLAGHVARVRARFAGDVELEEGYELRLSAAGYLDSQREMYPKGWRLGELHAFEVGDRFPRVQPADVPAGVRDLRFSLMVDQLNAFRVDENGAVGAAMVSAKQR